MAAAVSTIAIATLVPSGAAVSERGEPLRQPAIYTSPRSETCRSARRAVAYYRLSTWSYQDRRGAQRSDRTPITRGKSCSWSRYAASEHQARARSSRKAYLRWSYHWEWERWLPDKWQRIGACETGYGRRPGQWTWNSGTYQGAFGFYHGTWDQYKPAGAPSEAYLATPRQQYQCALNVYAAHGYGAWGCGGA